MTSQYLPPLRIQLKHESTSNPSFSDILVNTMRTNPLVHPHVSPTRLRQVQRLAIVCSAHPPAFTNVLPLRNSAIVEYVLRLYSSRLLKRRLHDSMMTGEMKVSEWLRRHPSAMHSQLGVSPTTFRLVLHDLEE